MKEIWLSPGNGYIRDDSNKIRHCSFLINMKDIGFNFHFDHHKFQDERDSTTISHVLMSRDEIIMLKDAIDNALLEEENYNIKR